MKKQNRIPRHLKNRRRMLVEITGDSQGRGYRIGEVVEVGCYITFEYDLKSMAPYYERGLDRNGDGVPAQDCTIVEILQKERKPVRPALWNRSK